MFLWRKSVSHLFQSIVYAKDQINPIRSWVATPNVKIDDLACELCTQCVPYPRCTCRRPSCCCPPGSWASPSSLPRLSPNFFRWVSWLFSVDMEIICFKDFYRKVFAISIFRRSMMHACYWSVFRDSGLWLVEISTHSKLPQNPAHDQVFDYWQSDNILRNILIY